MLFLHEYLASGGAMNQTVQTITQLRGTVENLEKRKTLIQKKIENEVAQARTKIKAGKKKEAMINMKRKKMYEKELEKLEGAQMSLETQVMTLESAQ